jgi:hypothetical protein
MNISYAKTFRTYKMSKEKWCNKLSFIIEYRDVLINEFDRC